MNLREKTQLPKLPVKNDCMKGPTDESNQIVPGIVYNGHAPGGYFYDQESVYSELEKLIKAGITTFVSLIGEDDSVDFFDNGYPLFIPSILIDSGLSIKVIHFKINDFSVRSKDHTLKFVSHL